MQKEAEHRTVLLVGGPFDGCQVCVHQGVRVYEFAVLLEKWPPLQSSDQEMPAIAYERRMYMQTDLDARIFKYQE